MKNQLHYAEIIVDMLWRSASVEARSHGSCDPVANRLMAERLTLVLAQPHDAEARLILLAAREECWRHYQ